MALRLLFAIPVSLMLCSWLVLESGHHSCAVRRFGQYSCVLLLEAPLELAASRRLFLCFRGHYSCGCICAPMLVLVALAHLACGFSILLALPFVVLSSLLFPLPAAYWVVDCFACAVQALHDFGG